MKTAWTSLGLIASLLFFTPINSNRIPELHQEIKIKDPDYTQELIVQQKIKHYEASKQEVIELQKELGWRK